MNAALLKILSYEAVQAETNDSGERVYDAPVDILGKIIKETRRNWQNPLEKAVVHNVLYTPATVTMNSRVRRPGDAKGYIIKQDLENGKYVLE